MTDDISIHLRPLRPVSLTLQFLLELGALAALGYWGYSTGESGAARAALALGVPLSAAIVWGLLGAPKAPFHLTGGFRLLLETAFFGSAAVTLAVAGKTWLAVALAITAAVNVGVLNALGHG